MDRGVIHSRLYDTEITPWISYFDLAPTNLQRDLQVSYEDLLSAMVNKTLVSVRVQNPTVTGASIGTAYYHQFSGYITDLTWNQSTTEFINFSGTIQSTGALDVIP